MGVGRELFKTADQSAELAALGGKSFAEGDGMTSTATILVGGGTLLALGVGRLDDSVLTRVSMEIMLLSSAKLEVVLKDFILQGEREKSHIQKILFTQLRSIQKLEGKIDSLRLSGSENDGNIKQWKKCVALMRKALARNVELSKQNSSASVSDLEPLALPEAF